MSVHDDKHKKGRNQAFYAIQSDSTGQELIACLDEGIDINHQDERGDTLLHWAVWNMRYEAQSILLDRGADINITNHKGASPLHHICEREENPRDRLMLFLNRGANPLIENAKGHTLYHKIAFYLHRFSSSSLQEIIGFLSKSHGFGGWHTVDHQGKTPLMIAQEKGNDQFPALIAALEKTEIEQATAPVSKSRSGLRL